MDSGHTTTRKGFLKGAGLALAGLFALGGSKRLAAKPKAERTANLNAPRAMSRVRPAKRAVPRNMTS